MSSLLSIDPGIRGCGAALFVDKQLVRADYIKSFVKTGNQAAEARAMAQAVSGWLSTHPAHIVVEWPRIYRNVRGKDPNDLLALCAVNAAIAALYPYAVVDSYFPAEWKGQQKKEICHRRIVKILGEAEAKILTDAAARAKSLSHNMMDAVGIGLFALGRFT